MSPKYRSMLAGLAAPGLLGMCAAGIASADATDGPETPAAPATSASTAPPASPAVLLLSNGHLVRGEIVATETDYVLKQKGGKTTIPRKKVEKAFGSMPEVYLYKRDRVPPDDADEHLKLARWCLSEQMTAEAAEQLEQVVDLRPASREAKAMLVSLRADEERINNRRAAATRDPEVVVTGGAAAKGDRVDEIHDQSIRLQTKKLRLDGPPVIFDLPPVLAIRRAGEFNQVIHRILQNSCVKCHDENYPGPFQMIRIRQEREFRDPDIWRQNMDATLRLVSQDAPSQSPLLTQSLVPHGGSKKAIMTGPNDTNYRALALWVGGLQSGPPRDARANPSGFGVQGSPAGPAETFASERAAGEMAQGSSPSATPTLPPLRPVTRPGRVAPAEEDGPEVARPGPPGRFAPGSYDGASPYAPPGTTFPATNLIDGTGRAPEAATPPPAAPGRRAPAPAGGPGLPSLPGDAPKPDRDPAVAPASANATADAAKKKPKKLDPDLLRKMLEQKRGAAN